MKHYKILINNRNYGLQVLGAVIRLNNEPSSRSEVVKLAQDIVSGEIDFEILEVTNNTYSYLILNKEGTAICRKYIEADNDLEAFKLIRKRHSKEKEAMHINMCKVMPN